MGSRPAIQACPILWIHRWCQRKYHPMPGCLVEGACVVCSLICPFPPGKWIHLGAHFSRESQCLFNSSWSGSFLLAVVVCGSYRLVQGPAPGVSGVPAARDCWLQVSSFGEETNISCEWDGQLPGFLSWIPNSLHCDWIHPTHAVAH